MSVKEKDRVLRKLNDLAEELKGDKEKSLKFLQDAGILDEEGNLTDPYKTLDWTSWEDTDSEN